jgi:hypothetical protein
VESEAHTTGRANASAHEDKPMKKLFLTCVAALSLIATAHAADMQVVRSIDGRTAVIIIEGDIVSGDYVKFKKIADRLSNEYYVPAVSLKSYGGLLIDGINIGITIRARGFSTFAYKYCMSVCAMMWLAGVQRSTLDDTLIGFHGAGYENGEPSIAGNAVVGAYLANLGFSYDVISALIKKGPKEMDWLSYEWAKALGIRVIRGTNCGNVKTGRTC